ncbi:MAG: cyclopropane-fatty-acyl-phospholipid synthase family protein [Blastocatellia bacterium]|nr:cyclopropane-fatty-acyl-phospholipid synthase family protein [Blastocatellia bacterium]
MTAHFNQPVLEEHQTDQEGTGIFTETGKPSLVERFYRKIVMSTLSSMTAGSLHLDFPEGGSQVIGTAGARPAAHIRIRKADFFRKCVLFGDIGFGEAFTAGDWDTPDVTEVIAWAIANVEQSAVISGARNKNRWANLLSFYNRLRHVLRPNSLQTSRRNIQEHYDLGNDFYSLFLDRTMTYSCALFSHPEQSLEAAQLAKYDALCRKLRLGPSDHVLEIGSGWGGFSCYAAKNYGCKITTVTISEAQFAFAKQKIEREGLAHLIEIRLEDYRHITGRFDKIVSIEMIEAVGEAYFETYFRKCWEVLKPNGLVGLQMITCPDSRYDLLRKNVDWIQKHIFPGSLLPSIGRINQAINRTGNLSLFELQDMGLCYARTLRLWREAFNRNLEQVRELGFDEAFVRTWNYYLSYCEAAFATRNISVVQAVYTGPNNTSLTEP